MTTKSMLVLITSMTLATSAAWAQSAASPAPAAAPAKVRNGYLQASEMPNVVQIVPPAPADNDPRTLADMAIYRATRALEGTPRWTLAQSDDSVGLPGLLNAYSCSLGVTLTRENAPQVSALLSKANADAGAAANVLKNLYQRKRPYQLEDHTVCLTPQGKASLERVPDYVSGHATAGWEAGLIFAELAPDAATAVLSRARAFGQSRVVCGVHHLSAVEGALMTSAAVFAAQNGKEEFRKDVQTATAELAALRRTTPTVPQSCSLENEALSKSPY
jgi:acid phosphatase (class A)